MAPPLAPVPHSFLCRPTQSLEPPFFFSWLALSLVKSISQNGVNMLSTLALLLAPALVSAHGAVTSYKIGGTEYAGYEVS